MGTPSPFTLLIRPGAPGSPIPPFPKHAGAARVLLPCPTAAAIPEQGKRVLHPSDTTPPSFLAPANNVPLPAPTRQFKFDFIFHLLGGKQFFCIFFFCIIYIRFRERCSN